MEWVLQSSFLKPDYAANLGGTAADQILQFHLEMHRGTV